MRRNLFLVEDGDTVVIISKTPLTVSDPCDTVPYVSQAYRVVADRVSPTLQLVPLSTTPTRLKVSEIPNLIAEEARWKFGAPLITSDGQRDDLLPPCGGKPMGESNES